MGGASWTWVRSRLCGGMKRQSKADIGEVLGEAPDAGNDPDCRDGEMSGGDREQVVACQRPYGLDDLVIRVEGLPHAHEDDVPDRNGRHQRRVGHLLHDFCAEGASCSFCAIRALS